MCYPHVRRRDARADAYVRVGLLHPRAQLVQLVAHELGLPDHLLLRLAALQYRSSARLSRRSRTARSTARRTFARVLALRTVRAAHLRVVCILSFSLQSYSVHSFALLKPLHIPSPIQLQYSKPLFS